MAPTIRPLAPEKDLEALASLYGSCSAKDFQQRVQGIDPERLAPFLAEGTCRAADSHPTWVAEERNRLVAIAALQPSHWHSEHTGFPVGKLTQLMTAHGAESVASALIETLESRARDERLQHLMGRVDAHAFPLQESLAARGWYPLGTSVKLVAHLNEDPEQRVTPAPLPMIPLRPMEPRDRERILEIGTQSHGENHLHFDPHLPRGTAQALFGRWVEKCIDGLAAQVWVAGRVGEVVGFATILEPSAFNRAMGTRIAVLDYIVVDHTMHGRGRGARLLQALHRQLKRHFDQIELRTTATNFPAINLYMGHGYRIVGADQVFGRWLGNP
ncbi:GNAT family N-acetyltransferase [Candidatus Sumerlaeota bacterium]|nr:GNAT family N-acetyltransferase [Candidatus Sumerlaeota bacterium]